MTEQTRITYDVRRAPRAQLIAELEEFAAHRAEQGKTDPAKRQRAEGARAAAAELAGGANQVQFEQAVLIVDEEPGRGSVRRGPKEWVLAELRESEEGWTHFGNRPLAWQAHRAVAEIESGATWVQVGHIEYEVTPEA